MTASLPPLPVEVFIEDGGVVEGIDAPGGIIVWLPSRDTEVTLRGCRFHVPPHPTVLGCSVVTMGAIGIRFIDEELVDAIDALLTDDT